MNVTKAGPYGGAIGVNYPRNEWWVAATSEEVTREPRQRWILDAPVVLYRKQDGGVVALDDRCPHRWAPLSKGWLEGDDIVCGYHGFQYCPQGDCVTVPSQAAPPARARVRSYPVIERAPLIWIWTGDPALSSASAPPDLPWLHEPGWSLGKGYTEVAANYMLLKENVLDLTHVSFVHRFTFGRFEFPPPKIDMADDRVEFRVEYPVTELPFFFAEFTGFGSRPIAQVDVGRYVSPAVQEGGREFIDPDPQPGARKQAAFRIMHATTPISPTRMHYFWFVGFDVPLSQEQIDAFTAGTQAGFDEDNVMLSAVQGMMEHDPRGANYPEIIVAADAMSVHARRLVLKRVAAERAQLDATARTASAAE